MLDDFMVRAALGGIGVAIAAGPLGSFVVWRRMAYFGDALAHSALLGVALGLILAINPMIGVLITGTVIAIAVVALQGRSRLASDTVLGLFAHSSLALGLIAVSLGSGMRLDLMGYLFGDLLAIGVTDLAIIYGGGLVVVLATVLIWRPLLAITIHEELAKAEGVPALAIKLIYTVLLAIVVAIAMRVIGVLLITALLLLPAAAARTVARTPEAMAVLASLIGAVAVLAGLGLSYGADTPSGPSVVVAALGLFIVLQIVAAVTGRD